MPYKIKSKLHRLFCENVKARRIELGLTQLEVAEKMGISQPSFAALESGRNGPTLVTIEELSFALHVNAAQLLLPQAVMSQ